MDLTDPIYGLRALRAALPSVVLPLDRVYIVPQTGAILDGRRGHTYAQLQGGELEVPFCIWYGDVTQQAPSAHELRLLL
jgi:hypothetical protein